MQSVGEQLGKSNLENFRSHPSLVSADAIGVELELEGWTSNSLDEASRALHPLWNTTSDGSLRNGGAEFITAGGLGGEKLHQAFERMCSLLERVNYDASWRCSTHMHINMLDFTVNQVARYLMVYAACEPVLFAHCGQFRRSSNFCTPVGDSLPFHKKLISRLWDDVITTRNAAQSCNKYTALNLQPLFGNDRQRALGTIEFRGGRPMTTVEEFTLQANLLLSIKQFVRTFDGNEEAMLTRLNDGVFNTVYANGCAASLSVPTSDLDDALVHAWMLLKSYQMGMKAPKKAAARDWGQVGASAFTGYAYNNAGGIGGETAPNDPRDPPILDANGLDRFGWWSSYASRTRPEEDVLWMNEERAVKLYRYQNELRDRSIPLNMKTQYIAVATTDANLRNRRMLGDSAAKFTIDWLLYDSDRDLRAASEDSPIPGIQRALEAQQLGIITCLVTTKTPSRQPKLNAGNYNVAYKQALGSRRWLQVLDWMGMSPAVHGSRDVFNALINTEVRVRMRDTLNNTLAALGCIIRIPAACTIPLLKKVLEMANLSSANHVHPADLELYDRYSAVVDALHGVTAAVPYYKPMQNTASSGWYPNGVLRLEHMPDSRLGIGISPHTNLPTGRRPRVSTFTNLNVY